MKNSIFRRVDRAKHRRMTQAGVVPRTVRILDGMRLLLLILPVAYGVVPVLAADKGALSMLNGWIAPWANWAWQHIPAIKNVLSDLTDAGYYSKLPLALHVYSVGVLYIVAVPLIGVIGGYAYRCYLASNSDSILYCALFNLKRNIIKGIIKTGGVITSRALRKEVMISVGGLLLTVGLTAFLCVNGLVEAGGDISFPLKYSSFQYTDWAAVLVLSVFSFFSLLNWLVFKILIKSLKIWYVNFKLPVQRKSELIGG